MIHLDSQSGTAFASRQVTELRDALDAWLADQAHPPFFASRQDDDNVKTP
jgi:hypothetical protein